MIDFQILQQSNHTIITAPKVYADSFDFVQEYVISALEKAKSQPHKNVIFDERLIEIDFAEIVMYELASFLVLKLEGFKNYNLYWVVSKENMSHMKVLEMLFTKIGMTGKVCLTIPEAISYIK